MTRPSHAFSLPASMALTMALSASSALADLTKAQCIDANGKGQELRRDGKLSAAREQFRQCADASCPSILRDDCTRRLDEVERMQPTMVFEAKDPAGKDLIAVAVSMDGVRLATSLTGATLAVDPGPHTFTFEVAGQAPIVQQFVLHEGEKARTERIVIGAPAAAPAAPAPAPAQATVAVAPAEGTSPGARPAPMPSAPPDAQATAGVGDGQRTLGLVGVGVGAAGLAVGAVFGALSMSAHSNYEQHCGGNIGAPPGQCDQTGVNGQSDAANKGTLSTILFAGGGVLAAVGVVLFFTAPRGGRVQAGVGPGNVLLRASW